MISKNFEFPKIFIEFDKYGLLNSESDSYLWLDSSWINELEELKNL